MIQDPRFAELPEPALRLPPSLRWSGEGLEIPEGVFNEEDLADLGRLYAHLQESYRAWLAQTEAPDWEALGARIHALGKPPLAPAMDRVGAATLRSQDAPPLVRRALHDLRGGALFALRMYGTLLEEESPSQELVEPAILLARDQAKVIRSLVPSLDREGYARDLEERAHGMRELVDKWEGFVFPAAEGPSGPRAVEVRAQTPWRGHLAARCLEAAALDRVVYNLVNNAARFAADDQVVLRVEAVGSQAVRLAVGNALAPDQEAWLQAQIGSDLSGLFLGGQTRGGHGVGLAAVATVVAMAWGLASVEDAVETGAVGARIQGGTFAAWFHWPALVVGDAEAA